MKLPLTFKRLTLPLYLLLFAFNACTQTGDSTSDTDANTSTIGTSAAETGTDATSGVGTIINRPSIPLSNLFPDFDARLPRTALSATEETSEDTSATTESASRISALRTATPLASTTEDEFPVNGIWHDYVETGTVNEMQSRRVQLQSLGNVLKDLFAEQGVTEVTDEPQTLTTVGEYTLVETLARWSIEAVIDTTNDAFVRFYFTNLNTGFIEATYLLESDASGNAMRGLFASVQPNDFSEDSTGAVRLFAIAYDFSDPTKNLFVARIDRHDNHADGYVALHIHEQCNEDQASCLGEIDEVRSTAPTRELYSWNIRYSWNEATAAVCIGDIDYSQGEVDILDTYSFTGPTAPAYSLIPRGACSLDETPYWGAHVYTAADLPIRYEDTAPHAGTAASYFVDGTVKTGWDTLTPDMIDGWLSATGF